MAGPHRGSVAGEPAGHGEGPGGRRFLGDALNLADEPRGGDAQADGLPGQQCGRRCDLDGKQDLTRVPVAHGGSGAKPLRRRPGDFSCRRPGWERPVEGGRLPGISRVLPVRMPAGRDRLAEGHPERDPRANTLDFTHQLDSDARLLGGGQRRRRRGCHHDHECDRQESDRPEQCGSASHVFPGGKVNERALRGVRALKRAAARCFCTRPHVASKPGPVPTAGRWHHLMVFPPVGRTCHPAVRYQGSVQDSRLAWQGIPLTGEELAGRKWRICSHGLSRRCRHPFGLTFLIQHRSRYGMRC